MKTTTIISMALLVVGLSVSLSSSVTSSTNALPINSETSTSQTLRTSNNSTGDISYQEDPGEGTEYVDDNDYEESGGDESSAREYKQEGANATLIEDYFGNIVKIDRNHTTLQPSKARNLILKSLILGPLIGVTIKSAILRGILWAILAYGLHLFFPSLLSSLGLGTGLVGFARQFNPGYMQMLVPQLTNLPGLVMNAVSQQTRLQLANYTSIYSPYLNPVVQTISSIPEESCRFRAICEAASYLIQSSPFMSSTLQRLSATAYVNIGTDYSKAWLDGVVGGDCATKYAACKSSPLKDIAARFASSIQEHTIGAAGASAATNLVQNLASNAAKASAQHMDS